MALRDHIRSFLEGSSQDPADMEELLLFGRVPYIEKLDNSLAQFPNLRKLSLSTNSIAQVSNLQGLGKLEILSLGRNQIKNLNGLDPVADSLRELWISYNNIERLSGIEKLKNLQILYMNHNKLASWPEFERLRELPNLEELSLIGNPLQVDAGGGEPFGRDPGWRQEVIRRLPNLKKLDGFPITPHEREAIHGPGVGSSSS